MLFRSGEPRGVSGVVAGFSSFDREYSLPHVLAQGSPISGARAARGAEGSPYSGTVPVAWTRGFPEASQPALRGAENGGAGRRRRERRGSEIKRCLKKEAREGKKRQERGEKEDVGRGEAGQRARVKTGGRKMDREETKRTEKGEAGVGETDRQTCNRIRPQATQEAATKS